MTYYCEIQNGEIARYNLTLPTSVGNTSIGPNATDLEQYGLYPVAGTAPSYDPTTQRLAGPTYEFDGTQVNKVYVVSDIPVEEIIATLIASVTEATQKRLDDFARTRNYDGILSACTYATDPNPAFAAEGQYCVTVRSQTWAALYTIMAEVQAGTRPMPSGFEDISNDLPVLAWSV